MKLEFRPDFKVRPSFKAVWPRLKGLFKGLKFKGGGYRAMAKRISAILGAVLLLMLAVVILIKLL